MDSDLRDAAFGKAAMDVVDGGSGGASGVLDLAVAAQGTSSQRWHAAVLYGVRGRYARAAALLDGLARDRDPVVASLACSTLASHRRQLGGHAEARRWDAKALRALGPSGRRPSAGTDVADGLDASGAWFDAVIGLAADAVGVGDLATATAVHKAAVARSAASGNGSVSWRTRVRLNWVRAEIALLGADSVGARRAAEHSIVDANEHGARRHRLKSEIILAASLGNDPLSRRLAEDAVETAKSAGWDTLEWPAARIAAAFDKPWDDYAERLIRVVYMAADPIGRTVAANSQWFPMGR